MTINNLTTAIRPNISPTHTDTQHTTPTHHHPSPPITTYRHVEGQKQKRIRRYIHCVEDGDEAPQWEATDDGDGNTYYYNHATGESSWERPRGLLRALAVLTNVLDK